MVALEIVLIHSRGSVLTAIGDCTRRGARRQGCAQPGIEIPITERLLERRESRLAGAVARCHEGHFGHSQAELTQCPQYLRLLPAIRHGIALQPALRRERGLESANLVRLPGGGRVVAL